MVPFLDELHGFLPGWLRAIDTLPVPPSRNRMLRITVRGPTPLQTLRPWKDPLSAGPFPPSVRSPPSPDRFFPPCWSAPKREAFLFCPFLSLRFPFSVMTRPSVPQVQSFLVDPLSGNSLPVSFQIEVPPVASALPKAADPVVPPLFVGAPFFGRGSPPSLTPRIYGFSEEVAVSRPSVSHPSNGVPFICFTRQMSPSVTRCKASAS